MFYLIASVLVIVSLFFLYSAITAFNELRRGIKKKVQAKPYMVVLFFVVAVILLVLAYAAIVYQTIWDQNWNEFWIDRTPTMSDESKSKIYNTVQMIKPITMYGAFIFGALFTISLLKLKRLTAHLFVGTIGLAIITFICFILIQYTEPERTMVGTGLHEQKIEEHPNKVIETDVPVTNMDTLSEIDKDSITRYFKNEYTDVLTLSQLLRNHFRIPRNISEANIDQLKQYARGLTEIKQNIVRIENPKGAEEAAKLTQEWLQQEINIVTDCLAEKRETGILGIIVKFNNTMADLIFDRNREHHNTTDKLRSMRNDFVNSTQPAEELDLKEYFSFIK